MKGIEHLQAESPVMTWEKWFHELCALFAAADGIEPIEAARYISVKQAKEWYNDGFTPQVCFRENMS